MSARGKSREFKLTARGPSRPALGAVYPANARAAARLRRFQYEQTLSTTFPDVSLTDDEWVQAKAAAIEILDGARLDEAGAHLAYIRSKIANI